MPDFTPVTPVASVASPTIEQTIGDKFSEIRTEYTARINDGKKFVRKEPEKAVLYAVIAGYILRLLPVGALVRTLASLVLFCVKPLAVFYGVAKGYEILQRSKN